jgi:hypothetical protein
MKKLLMAALFAATAFAAQAQEVTPQSLEGKWNAAYMAADGMSVDLEKKTYTIDQDIKDDFGADFVASMEGEIKKLLESGAGFTVDFKGNAMTFTDNMSGQTEIGNATYELTPGNPAILTVTMEDGEVRVEEVVFKDGNLEVTGKGTGAKMIMKKVK